MVRHPHMVPNWLRIIVFLAALLIFGAFFGPEKQDVSEEQGRSDTAPVGRDVSTASDRAKKRYDDPQ